MKIPRSPHKLTKIVCAITMFLAAAGCSSAPGSKAEEPAPAAKPSEKTNEPITLKIAWVAGEDFAKRITDHPYIKRNFPNVTFEFQPIAKLDEMLTANTPPDIMNVDMDRMVVAMKAGMYSDLTPLIQKHRYDLNLFPKPTIESVRRYSKNGELYGIPDKRPESLDKDFTPYAMLYNKDIFDRFNVPYPKDGMTWDEAIELGRKLTRVEDGVSYKGLSISGGVDKIIQQLDLRYASESGKVDFSGPGWFQAFDTMRKAYEAYGGWPAVSLSSFYKDRNVAMQAGFVEDFVFHPEVYESMNWDVATFPKVGTELIVPPAFGMYIISPQSKYKDEAFRIITAFLSDEMQKERRVNWDDPLIRKRNFEAVRAKKIPTYIPGEFSKTSIDVINAQLKPMLDQKKDTNTILRELQENIQNKVDQQLKQK